MFEALGVYSKNSMSEGGYLFSSETHSLDLFTVAIPSFSGLTSSYLNLKAKSVNRFSLLRFISLSALMVGARAQNTEPFPAIFELSALNSTTGFTLNGIAAGDNSGLSVSSAGDVNGDGITDLIVGAWHASPGNRVQAGQAYVVFGRQTLFPSVFELSSLDGTNGFILNGVAAGDESALSVSSAGDVSGDGVADILIGARYGASGSGQAYVVFGLKTAFPAVLELSSLDGTNGFTLNGAVSGNSGWSVSTAGDVNGDGVDDLVIGAPESSPEGRSAAGQAYVLFGRQTAFPSVVELLSLDGINGFVVSGIVATDYLGASVSSAGDVNGDGVADLVIGAWRASPEGRSSAGQTYVIFGRKTSFPAVFELSSLDNSTGVTINGIQAEDRSGFSVSQAGDVNGDGVSDLVISAPLADLDGRSNAGQTYVVFGRRTLFPAVFELSSLDGTNGFTLNGVAANDESGYSSSSVGDVDGDGVSDFIIGGYYADPSGRANAGQAYVVFGRKNSFSAILELSSLDGENGFTLNGVVADDSAGVSVSSAGDVNGDGIVDLVIGAYRASPGFRSNAGQAYVVFGRQTVSLSSSTQLTNTPLVTAPLKTSLTSTTLSISGNVNSEKSVSTSSSTSFVTSPIDSEESSTLLYVGIALGVVALFCSIFGLGGYLYRKRDSSSFSSDSSFK